VRVAGRDRGSATELASRLVEETGLAIVAAGSFAEALAGADVVCAATAATEPVVRREWLAPGMHVNSVGYTTAGREVDADTIRDAVVVVESREAALGQSNDLRLSGVADPVDAELGELVAGIHPGRTCTEQITLYKSLGVATEDDAAAVLVLTAAEREGLGTVVDL
jgi:ornithine cyclodeaminase